MGITIRQGGGSIWVGYGSELRLEKCTLRNNRAMKSWGGAVYVGESAEAFMQKTEFINNFAFQRGGAIYTQAAYTAVREYIYYTSQSVALFTIFIYFDLESTGAHI
jgi:predicted outer membrane repeat protein